jgi:hypothetical protein
MPVLVPYFNELVNIRNAVRGVARPCRRLRRRGDIVGATLEMLLYTQSNPTQTLDIVSSLSSEYVLLIAKPRSQTGIHHWQDARSLATMYAI